MPDTDETFPEVLDRTYEQGVKDGFLRAVATIQKDIDAMARKAKAIRREVFGDTDAKVASCGWTPERTKTHEALMAEMKVLAKTRDRVWNASP